MTKTKGKTDALRLAVREELQLRARLKLRREQLSSFVVPHADFAGFPDLKPIIPSLESITQGVKKVEDMLKEEFGDDYYNDKF